MFADADFEFWYSLDGAQTKCGLDDFGHPSLEGGDVIPIGNGAVLVGCGERTTPLMVEHIAKAFVAKDAAQRMIAGQMTQDQGHIHLDTVFTFVDRDTVTIYRTGVDEIVTFNLRPGDGEDTVSVTTAPSSLKTVDPPKLRVVTTGGDEYQVKRDE